MEGRPLLEQTDDVLVRRAQGGDIDAFAELVRRYQEPARRLAYVIGGAVLDADDVAQDAMIKGFRAIGGFRLGSSFRAWLLRIVANEASNRRRSAGRRAGHELRLATDRASGEAAPSAEAAVLAAEARRVTLAAVAALPGRQRDVIACRYLVGLSEAETAAVLGLPVGTVKSRSARAMDRLRDQLQLGGDDA
ncbi:MAG: RNA polymerase sigma factor [Acidimicrobiales bacterium]